jgi:hypothetical protein
MNYSGHDQYQSRPYTHCVASAPQTYVLHVVLTNKCQARHATPVELRHMGRLASDAVHICSLAKAPGGLKAMFSPLTNTRGAELKTVQNAFRSRLCVRCAAYHKQSILSRKTAAPGACLMTLLRLHVVPHAHFCTNSRSSTALDQARTA